MRKSEREKTCTHVIILNVNVLLTILDRTVTVNHLTAEIQIKFL